jgi:hypothetical protein
MAGYRVYADGVVSAGADACTLADTLRGIRRNWDTASRDGSSACGLPVTGEAYRAMQDAWFDEVGVHIRVLEEICEALDAAGATYHTVEGAEAERFAAGAGDGQ